MKILYLGDVMGEPGIRVVERRLHKLRLKHGVDVVVAQAENVTDGKGLSVEDYQRLRKAGVDGFTGGNHTLVRPETAELLRNPEVPVTAPVNMHEAPGPGYKFITVKDARILIISLLGQIVGRDADKPVDNPLQKIDELLASLADEERAATIINFHGDYSSEKVIIGHYLDARASVVVGDHWHVPTADARILPCGTAHMTDVGMVGALDSSLGVTYESVIPRWRDSLPTKNELATKPPYQLSGLLVEIDGRGLAISTEHIYEVMKD